MGTAACAGGSSTGNFSCNIGYKGPLCAVCAAGYYQKSDQTKCQSCSMNRFQISTQAIMFGIIILIVFLFLANFLYLENQEEHGDETTSIYKSWINFIKKIILLRKSNFLILFILYLILNLIY
jgi:hypothetical protein